MYIRRNISLKLLFKDSWRFLLLIGIWSSLLIYINDIIGVAFLSLPMMPITTLGIAVALHLGLKNKKAYERWWEGRKIWGDIINKSRAFSNQVHSLVYKEKQPLSQKQKEELIYRHIAWVKSLKYQLRSTSRLDTKKKRAIFHHKVIKDDPLERIKTYLSEDEYQKVHQQSNMATQILIKQGKALQELAQEGYLDSIRHTQMNTTLTQLYDTQGQCERIKKTPFPRPIAHLGQIFTYIFIFLLPFGFLDLFEHETQEHFQDKLLQIEYIFAMVPFSMVLSWVFLMMEKVSDSMEDPFESGMNDLPLDAMVRTIEIDLLESLEKEEIPEPVKPINDILS